MSEAEIAAMAATIEVLRHNPALVTESSDYWARCIVEAASMARRKAEFQPQPVEKGGNDDPPKV